MAFWVLMALAMCKCSASDMVVLDRVQFTALLGCCRQRLLTAENIHVALSFDVTQQQQRSRAYCWHIQQQNNPALPIQCAAQDGQLPEVLHSMLI